MYAVLTAACLQEKYLTLLKVTILMFRFYHHCERYMVETLVHVIYLKNIEFCIENLSIENFSAGS